MEWLERKEPHQNLDAIGQLMQIQGRKKSLSLIMGVWWLCSPRKQFSNEHTPGKGGGFGSGGDQSTGLDAKSFLSLGGVGDLGLRRASIAF
jgi:hypothetical protein